MAVGAVTSVAVAPLILHAHWDTLRNLAQGREWQAASGALVAQALLVVTAVVGSLLPDLDQRNSLAARRVERLGQVVAFVFMAALLFLMHWQTHLVLWALAIVVSFALGTNSNIARRIGLGITGAGLLFLAVHGAIPILGAILLAVWIVGAMFTEHRTFTHSLLGTALFVAGAFTVLNALSQVHGVPLSVAAWGLTVGYVLHLAADSVAGGVPLLWPWNERQGIRLIRTGGFMDSLIGVVAACLCIVFVVV